MIDHGKLSAAMINEAIAKDQGWKKKTWHTPFGDREYWLSPDGREEGDVPDYCGSLDDTWDVLITYINTLDLTETHAFSDQVARIVNVALGLGRPKEQLASSLAEMIYEKVVGK